MFCFVNFQTNKSKCETFELHGPQMQIAWHFFVAVQYLVHYRNAERQNSVIQQQEKAVVCLEPPVSHWVPLPDGPFWKRTS